MDKRILLTGSGGFIGTHTIEPLLNQGYKILAGDCNTYLEPSRCYERVLWDILDHSATNEIMNDYKPTHLLHLAWNVGDGYLYNTDNLEWMNATINLVNSFFMSGGTRAVCAGSCFEYDLSKETQYMETEALLPTSLYAVAKASAGQVLLNINPTAPLNLAWARIFFPYGPWERPNRLIPTIIRGLLMEGKAEIKSRGNLLRDFVYVADVADTLVELLSDDHIGPVNVVGHESSRCNIRTVSNTITDILDMDRECVRIGTAPIIGEAESIIGHSKFKWSKTSLVRGLTKTINWWKKNI